MATSGQVNKTMAAPRSDSSLGWFEKLSQGNATRLCLFCFPYAGGSAQVFRPWRRHFSPEIDVCLVHLPGRGNRFGEPPFTRMRLLVDAIAYHIRGELRHPFAFYGHSMGAVIGFELARVLRGKYGIEPSRLFLSGRRAPHAGRSKPTTFDLPHDEFIAEVRRLNGTPKELLDNPETSKLFLPVLKADFELVETYEYEPEPQLSCPITVYGGLIDKDVPVTALREWQEHTTAQFEMRLFPGDHFFIHTSKPEFLEAFRLDLLESLRAAERS